MPDARCIGWMQHHNRVSPSALWQPYWWLMLKKSVTSGATCAPLLTPHDPQCPAYRGIGRQCRGSPQRHWGGRKFSTTLRTMVCAATACSTVHLVGIVLERGALELARL